MSTFTDIRKTNRRTEIRRVVISEVNPPAFSIQAKDSQGTIIHITFSFHEPLLVIPKVGQTWIVSRYDNEWRLLYRKEDSMITQDSSLTEGDQRIEADNNLYLNAHGDVYINGEKYTPEINEESTSTTDIDPTPTAASLGLGSWTRATTPPLLPFNGDFWVYPANALGANWTFQYNAGNSSSFKWECIGGPPLEVYVLAPETTSVPNAGYNDFLTSQSITVPRSGDYRVEGGSGSYSTGTGAPFWISVKLGSAATTDNNGANPATGGSVFTTAVALGLTAGDTVRLQGKHTFGFGAQIFTQNRYLRIHPIRVS